MKCRVALVLALLALPRVATADEPRRVVVSGPQNDAVAARVVKELVAMGFDVVRAPDGADCTRRAVAARLRDEGGDAAACSDGDSVAIWIAEPAAPRLRDVVVVRDDDAHSREVAAVRAAEIARASLQLDEPAPLPPPTREPELEPASSLPVPADRATPPTSQRRTATLLAGFGVGTAINPGATVGTLTGRIEIGVLRHVSLALRADIPFDARNLDVSSTATSPIKASSGFVGAGVSFPFLPPSSILVPRLGGGFALLWVKTTSTGIVPSGEAADQSTSGSMLGAYADGALSLRIYGPLRIAVDGAIGATPARVVVRDSTFANVAYFGQPFGAFGSRLELELP
ncbi:MAG TPA: hypothetical protein VIF62_28405 [Labilithrix sp.]|jgi:hypothetical protein